MGKPAPTVEALLSDSQWQAERHALRAIILELGLKETVKWGKLCYLFDGQPVALIFNQKPFCAIGFPKGVLLDDPDKVLIAPGANSQSMRRLHFISPSEVAASEALIRTFLEQAIEIERSGQKVDKPAKDTLVIPDDLQAAFADDPKYGEAFERLTPGRQRSHIIHINGSKKPETRANRIDKSRAKVLMGKGQTER